MLVSLGYTQYHHRVFIIIWVSESTIQKLLLIIKVIKVSK